ncbi:MAG: hypothetical protein ISS36_00700 [Candidatus Aenigmarchaeota archaeon]|nr:hypothetical protein [Candidatus Aenigmarchaeota archaeon]
MRTRALTAALIFTAATIGLAGSAREHYKVGVRHMIQGSDAYNPRAAMEAFSKVCEADPTYGNSIGFAKPVKEQLFNAAMAYFSEVTESEMTLEKKLEELTAIRIALFMCKSDRGQFSEVDQSGLNAKIMAVNAVAQRVQEVIRAQSRQAEPEKFDAAATMQEVATRYDTAKRELAFASQLVGEVLEQDPDHEEANRARELLEIRLIPVDEFNELNATVSLLKQTVNEAADKIREARQDHARRVLYSRELREVGLKFHELAEISYNKWLKLAKPGSEARTLKLPEVLEYEPFISEQVLDLVHDDEQHEGDEHEADDDEGGE